MNLDHALSQTEELDRLMTEAIERFKGMNHGITTTFAEMIEIYQGKVRIIQTIIKQTKRIGE